MQYAVYLCVFIDYHTRREYGSVEVIHSDDYYARHYASDRVGVLLRSKHPGKDIRVDSVEIATVEGFQHRPYLREIQVPCFSAEETLQLEKEYGHEQTN